MPFTPASTSTTSAGAMGVNSSRPAEWTTSAFFTPRRSRLPAMSSLMSVLYVPTSPYSACAGLSSGPSMLRAVRTLRAERTGRTAFMAGWYLGAYMNAMLASSRQRLMPSGPRSMETPRASSTSALPHRLDTERLPCFATLAPAAAATMEAPVEMLTEPMPSPPVPTMSTTPPDLVLTGRPLSSMARASPAISSGVSPLARSSTRKAAACSVTKSSSRTLSVCAACSSVRSLRAISISRTSRIGSVARQAVAGRCTVDCLVFTIGA
mmetsp:Transcript_8581/g.18246  ORF Transcript_8581/g.18246 Transcript_8581/m.18246 type:complete len:266 (-) Transcript_8581:175-972(-)